MIDIVFCLRRRADLSSDEFARHLREVRGPMVAERAAMLGIRRYVQYHPVDEPMTTVLQERHGCSAETFDAVVVASFDGVDALTKGAATPEGLRAGEDLLEDEERFLDREGSRIWITEAQAFVGD